MQTKKLSLPVFRIFFARVVAKPFQKSFFNQLKLMCYIISLSQNIMLLTISVARLGDLLDFWPLLKPLATINLPKSPTFLGNFCKGVKIYRFSCEIILGQLYRHLAIFFGHTVDHLPVQTTLTLKSESAAHSRDPHQVSHVWPSELHAPSRFCWTTCDHKPRSGDRH